MRPASNSSIVEEPHQSQEVDVSLLLDTPRIKRLSELRTAANAAFSSTPVREISTRHSILKVHSHSVSKKSLSPEDAVNEDTSRTTGRAVSSDRWTELNIDYKKTEERKESEAGVLSVNRQIRFALPKESTLDRRKSVMGASPRKPLYEGNVALSKDTQGEERRPGDTARPLCFFPRPSSSSRDTEASLSVTVNAAKKVDRSLSFSPSPRKRDSVNREENIASCVAAIKGKYFFPPKPKIDDDSEENQEDSFVSATSDIGSNAEDTSGDIIHSSTVVDSGSKDLKQNVSPSAKIAEYHKHVDSVQSEDDHKFREQSVKADNYSRVTLISPRITKRESYRKSNVSVLTDRVTHGVGSGKLPNSPSNDLVKFKDSTRAIDNFPHTSHGATSIEKSSTSVVNLCFEKEANISSVTANKESILSFSHSSVTHNASSTSVYSRADKILSTVAEQKSERNDSITRGVPSHLETQSSFSHVATKGAVGTNNKTDKDSSKLLATFLSDTAVVVTSKKTPSRQEDHRIKSPGDTRDTKKTVLLSVEDVVMSDKSSLMRKEKDSTSTMPERTLYPSDADTTIHNKRGEQLCEDVNSAGIVKESVSFDLGDSPKFDKSSVTLASTETKTAGSENSVQKKSRSRLISSFFPKSSSSHSRGDSSSSEQSAGEIRHQDNTEAIEKNTEDTPKIEQSPPKPLAVTKTDTECITRTPETASASSDLVLLPNGEVIDSPVSTLCSKQSKDLQKSANNSRSYASNVTSTPEDTPKSDKSSSSLGIRDETGGNISSTPKEICSTHIPKFLLDTTSYLPDNTVWNTPSNSSRSDNEQESAYITKISEREITVVMEETLETDKSSTSLIHTNSEMVAKTSDEPSEILVEGGGNVSFSPKETYNTSVSSFLPDTTCYLPDNTTWNMISNTSCNRSTESETQSVDNTKSRESSIMVTMAETLESEKSTSSLNVEIEGNTLDISLTSPIGIRAETGGNVSSTPKKTVTSFLPDTTSFLPDNTMWNSPINSSRTRHPENESQSADNTKMSERSVLLTMGATLETDKSSNSLVDAKKESTISSMTQRICSSPVSSFLPDTTSWNSPSHSFDNKQLSSERSPPNLQEDSENVTVTLEDSLEIEEISILSLDRKSVSRYLPDDTNYDSSSEKDLLENHLHSEVQETGRLSGESRTDPDDKGKECLAVDNDDDDDEDDDDDWHASANEEEEESDEADEEPLVVDNVLAADAESSSSSSASIILISSSSSSDSSDSSSSENEGAVNERKRVCHSRTSSLDFDPLVDPESDTDEEAAEAAVALQDQGTESQNVDLKQSDEECRDQQEMHEAVTSERDCVTDIDTELRGNDTSDVVTEKVMEAENVDIQSISTVDCKVSETVCTDEPSDACGTTETLNINKKRSRKGLSERQLSRCSSEPPTNVETSRRPRAKKTRSTDSLNKLTHSSVIPETSMNKVSQFKDEAKHSAAAEAVSEGHRNSVVDDSPNVKKEQSISDSPELPNESMPDDIRKSIQDWMNSPVVTRAGFRRLSSIQSEPPQLDDVSDIVSLPRTRRKKTSSVIMESTSKKQDSKYKSQSRESGRITGTRSEAQSAEHEQQMEEYTTERRLTRYQRSLLARSADLAAGRGRSTQSHELKTLSLPSESPVRLRSSGRQYTPSPGEADNVSVAHSEDSEVSSSLTSSSFLQRSPRSARSEEVTKRSSRRSRNTAVHSPSSVRSMPVAPVVSQRGRLRQVKKKGGEVSEEFQKAVSTLHPARRTKSHSSLDASKSKPSPNTSHEELQAKGELRVTRSVARQGLSTSHLALQPIPEESTSSSADASNKELTPSEQRKRKHESRSPVPKKASPRNKKQESTRISPRKAMRLRSRLLK